MKALLLLRLGGFQKVDDVEVAGLYDRVALQGVVAVLDEGVILRGDFVGHGLLRVVAKDGYGFVFFWRFGRVRRFQVVEERRS